MSEAVSVRMNYIRELLYRPKRSDKSLLARFYFADLNLNAVAAELDSFDGRKVSTIWRLALDLLATFYR